MDGKSIRSKFTIVEDSPTAYSYSWEASIDGSPVSKIMEGKATKMEGPPAVPKKLETPKK